MDKKFVGLIILDGYGLRESAVGNAIALANPEYINSLFKNYPFTTLEASGVHVGLPSGQIGNSEVGHLNIGAGRVVLQMLQKINSAIENGSFYENKNLLAAIEHAKKNNSSLHIMGLASTGGVHSHIIHLFELINLAERENVKRVYLHLFTDGRDTLRTSGKGFVESVINKIKTTNVKIATVSGRFYAMDREQNYERTQAAYNALVRGEGHLTTDVVASIEKCYDRGVYDEYLPPFVLANAEEPVAKISTNDAIIFFNYREDRARQLTRALVEDNFTHFSTEHLKNVFMTTFTNYDVSFKKPKIAFETNYLNVNLSQVVSNSGLKQFKITETTKYAHVTYFLNGGIEKAYDGEDRFLIETIKVDKFDKTPQMRAKEITDKATALIRSGNYSLMVLNYSNCDMLGHTGNLFATIETVKVINHQLEKLVNAILEIGGVAVICADHGNAEEMISEQGHVLTDHTTNKVPFAIVGEGLENLKLKQGVLGNIAPTILELLNIEKPLQFECDSLILKK